MKLRNVFGVFKEEEGVVYVTSVEERFKAKRTVIKPIFLVEAKETVGKSGP